MSEMTRLAAILVMTAAAAVMIGNTAALLVRLRRQEEPNRSPERPNQTTRRGAMTTVWMIETENEVIFTQALHDLNALPGEFVARRLTVIGDAVLDEDGRPVHDRIARRARLGAFGLVIVPREIW